MENKLIETITEILLDAIQWTNGEICCKDMFCPVNKNGIEKIVANLKVNNTSVKLEIKTQDGFEFDKSDFEKGKSIGIFTVLAFKEISSVQKAILQEKRISYIDCENREVKLILPGLILLYVSPYRPDALALLNEIIVKSKKPQNYLDLIGVIKRGQTDKIWTYTSLKNETDFTPPAIQAFKNKMIDVGIFEYVDKKKFKLTDKGLNVISIFLK